MVHRYAVAIAGQTRAVEVEAVGNGRVRVVIDGRERTLDVRRGGGRLSWLDGSAVVEAFVDGTPGKQTVTIGGQAIAVEVGPARPAAAASVARAREAAAGPMSIRAPIPGRVAKILVRAGDKVAAGRGLIVLEAMKMENEIRAPREGTVREVRCAEGAAVDAGQELVSFE